MKTQCPTCDEERETKLLAEVRMCTECSERIYDETTPSLEKYKVKVTKLKYRLRDAEGRARDFMMALVRSSREYYLLGEEVERLKERIAELEGEQQ